MTKFRKVTANLSYTKEQFDKIKAGFTSSDMDDKWNITYEPDILHFYRSWTDEKIYSAKIEQTDNGCQIKEVFVASDSEEPPTDDYDCSVVADLIRLYLLN